MSAMLQVIRPFRLADAARPYQIVLDGEATREIRNNASAEMPIAAGTHTLRVRVGGLLRGRPGRGSQEVTFQVGDGETAQFSCHPPAFWESWLAWIASLLGDPDKFIRLEQAPVP
jgi:hypothetical protein